MFKILANIWSWDLKGTVAPLVLGLAGFALYTKGLTGSLSLDCSACRRQSTIGHVNTILVWHDDSRGISSRTAPCRLPPMSGR